jgi:hypothetical protein
MRVFSIDQEPLSPDELKSEIAQVKSEIQRLSRLMPLYLVVTITMGFAFIFTILFSVVLLFAISLSNSTILDTFKNYFWFSPVPYFLILMISGAIYSKFFKINGIDHEYKIRQQRAYRKSLKDISQGDCIEIVEMLTNPEISDYRNKVVAQARVFIRAEVEMMRQFHSSLGAREACKKVYVENLTSRRDAEPEAISV